MFDLSKLSGHAATRFGWSLIKNSTLANAIIGPLLTETFGVSVDAMDRSAHIIGQILHQGASGKERFFSNTAIEMGQRWTVRCFLFWFRVLGCIWC